MNETIAKKLSLFKYARKALIQCPADLDYFDGMPVDRHLTSMPYDLIIHFIYSLSEFEEQVKDIICKRRLNPDGVVYFVYPKKGNKKYVQYIGRDDFFVVVNMNDDGYVADSPIKFNKMVALDETFTVIGLKHVARQKQTNQPSQCVSAYVDKIPDLIRSLSAHPDALAIFEQLTPGYQRGWARYVYAVKTEATREAHIEEMLKILRAGYKSIDLYRAAQ